SAYGALGRSEAAYFRKINDEGGINGRKIVFISLDDGYSPPKTVEATRRLVEQDEVLLMFGSLGIATITAVDCYLNTCKVTPLIVQLQGSGADVFVDFTTPKFAAQAIRKAYDTGWKPVHYLSSVGNYVASVLVLAGLDKSIGLISTQTGKDPNDPTWINDPGMV